MDGGNPRRFAESAMYQRSFLGGALHITGFGYRYKDEADIDWTFRNLGDPNSPPARHLPAIAKQLGVSTILAPLPTAFNGKIIDAAELTTRIELGEGVTMFRNNEKPADGVLLERGQAYAMTGAGCATLHGAVINPHTKEIVRVGAAHMGLKSLLNNVTGNLLAALGDSPTDTWFGVEFPISPKLFIHEWNRPEDGEQNRLLCEQVVREFGVRAVVDWGTEDERKGMIDIFEIARSQLTRLAVPKEQIARGMSIVGGSVFYTTRESDKRNLTMLSFH